MVCSSPVLIVRSGKLVRELPRLDLIRDYCRRTNWPRCRRSFVATTPKPLYPWPTVSPRGGSGTGRRTHLIREPLCEARDERPQGSKLESSRRRNPV